LLRAFVLVLRLSIGASAGTELDEEARVAEEDSSVATGLVDWPPEAHPIERMNS